MMEQTALRPLDFHRWDRWALAVLLVLLLFLAIEGRDRKERDLYERFQEQAPKVQAALERYAAEHQDRFPPDAMFCARPEGLGEEYIKWDPAWKIDYEVHDNGEGGQYVCLEFGGPFKQRLYFGLCNIPEYRRKYGRGEAIPGQVNRIWVIREQADIM